MYKKLFPPELRTASIVPRWSIVWTLNKDYVSNHSYFVTIYARQIAKVIGWKGSMEDLMVYALYHDLEELITGDIVSPVKREIVDPEKSRAYVDGKMGASMPGILADIIDVENDDKILGGHGIKKIVKAADRLDALLFLITERRLGNSIIEPRIADAKTLFDESWMELPGLKQMILDTLKNVMWPEISYHLDRGGFGV